MGKPMHDPWTTVHGRTTEARQLRSLGVMDTQCITGRRTISGALVVAVLVLGTASIPGAASRVEAHETTRAAEQTGMASWYGGKHHGRTTASGATFDQNALTAAHRSLPFGSRIEVTNLRNGQRVEVEVNDRGPFIPRRIVDLSRGAARRIGAIGHGVVPVRLRVLSTPARRAR
jgi:rare lipoprotein A